MKTLLVLMAIAAIWASTLLAGTTQRAEATPAFAQRTGKGCPTCHTAPPNLNGTGKKFKANGNKF